MKAPFVRSPYNYDTNAAGDEAGLKCQDKSLTQQHMADECNINVLVERFVVSGEIPELNAPPLQGDFTAAPTYQEALNLMVAANRSFMQLPAKLRNRFENDPGQFVNFCSDEQNRDEMRQMGLWSPEAVANFELQAKTAREAEIALAVQADRDGPRKKEKGDNQKGVT